MRIKLKNTYIIISPLFILVILWSIITSRQSEFTLCFLALIIHELGHLVTTYLQKEKISIFKLLPIGFSCRLKNQTQVNKNKMIKILIAGPAVSLTAAGLFFYWTKDFALINLLIGLINLLPIGELDGMRIIDIIIERKIYK